MREKTRERESLTLEREMEHEQRKFMWVERERALMRGGRVVHELCGKLTVQLFGQHCLGFHWLLDSVAFLGGS